MKWGRESLLKFNNIKSLDNGHETDVLTIGWEKKKKKKEKLWFNH